MCSDRTSDSDRDRDFELDLDKPVSRRRLGVRALAGSERYASNSTSVSGGDILLSCDIVEAGVA